MPAIDELYEDGVPDEFLFSLKVIAYKFDEYHFPTATFSVIHPYQKIPHTAVSKAMEVATFLRNAGIYDYTLVRDQIFDIRSYAPDKSFTKDDPFLENLALVMSHKDEFIILTDD